MLITTSHGTLAEISRVSNSTILVKKVLKEGDTTIEVNIDLLTKLGLTLDGSHHLRLRHGEIVLPVSILGVVKEFTKLLIEVKTDIKIEISTFLILIKVLDTLGVHIGILHHFPCNGEDEISIVMNLRPVGVQESNSLLTEGLLANSAEVIKRFLIKLFDERGHYQ